MSADTNDGCCGKDFYCGSHGQQRGTRECAECRRLVSEEIKTLKEQLARMNGALRKWKEFFESDRGGRGVSSFDRVCWVKGNKALSSYDPKWIVGVRAKAQEEIVDYLTLKFAENGPVGIAHDIRKLWKNLETVRQPNQSREKRG